MIENKRVENIRKHGNFKSSADGWKKVLLEELGYPAGEKAEYVIVAGCFHPESMPHIFRIFKGLLDLWHVSYSLLRKENCCGMPFIQSAVLAKNEDEVAISKELSREFILENFQQAKAMGAKSVVLFCPGCESLYSIYAASTGLEIITYAGLIDRFYKGGKLNIDIDYYGGCHRFRRYVTQEPFNDKPTLDIFSKIEQLHVNYLENKLCCMVPVHLDRLSGDLKAGTVGTMCPGCYTNLSAKLQKSSGVEVKMLPELVMESILNRGPNHE